MRSTADIHRLAGISRDVVLEHLPSELRRSATFDEGERA